MAPKVPPPSDPTSLLWAHQMKREHGHLLQKVEKLEVAISRIEALALAAQNRETDVAAIAQKVQTLAEESTNKNSAATEEAVEKIRREVTNQFEDLDDRLEAIINKLDAVDKAGETAASNRKDAFDREVEMLKRVKGLEAGMKTYRDNLRILGRKVDKFGVEQIQAQLSKLIQKANDAGEDHERVQSTLTMLENATEALTRENEKLHAQVSEMREDFRTKVAEAAMPAPATGGTNGGIPQPAANAVANTKAPKTVAGRDTSSAQSPKKSSTAPARKIPGRVKKSTVAVVKPAGDKTMSRELKNLMSDVSPLRQRRTIKPIVNHQPAPSKGVAKVVATSKKQIAKDEKTQKPIVGRGKGWIKVVEVVGRDEEDGEDDEDLAELAKLVPPSNAMQTRIVPPSNAKKNNALPPSNIKQAPTRKSPSSAKQATPRKANTDFAGNLVPGKRRPGRPRKKTNELAHPRARPLKVWSPEPTSTSAADNDPALATKRGPGRTRKLVREASIQRSVEQPDPPAQKRRVIEQNDNTQMRAVFGTTPKGKKRKMDADAIDESMDLSAPRASRNGRGTPAPVSAKRQKQQAPYSPKPVHTYGISKVKSGANKPAAAKNLRKDPHRLPSSSVSPLRAVGDPVQGLLDAAEEEHAQVPGNMPNVQKKVSRKRTIPQFDDRPISGKPGEVFEGVGIDKDFEM